MTGKRTATEPYQRARNIFRKHGGVLCTKEAIEAGIHPRTLYAMRDEGVIEKLARGLYSLPASEPLANPDLVTVAKKIPKGVICLISALAFHEITIQVPHEIHVALPRNAQEPRLPYPPIRVFEFSEQAFEIGIETHTLDGVPVRIYDAEKTLADCFKYRNKLGLDVAIEALRLYVENGNLKVDAIMRYARACRVANVMKPYLEAIL